MKWDIGEDEVLREGVEVLGMFENMSDDEEKEFRKGDVVEGMNM